MSEQTRMSKYKDLRDNIDDDPRAMIQMGCFHI